MTENSGASPDLQIAPVPRPIADYGDYRIFLKDRFLFLKSQHGHISYRYLSGQVGTTTSYFKHVLAGRKNISLDKVYGVGSAFAMSPPEIRYLFYKVIEQTNSCMEVKKEAQKMLASIEISLNPSAFPLPKI